MVARMEVPSSGAGFCFRFAPLVTMSPDGREYNTAPQFTVAVNSVEIKAVIIYLCSASRPWISAIHKSLPYSQLHHFHRTFQRGPAPGSSGAAAAAIPQAAVPQRLLVLARTICGLSKRQAAPQSLSCSRVSALSENRDVWPSGGKGSIFALCSPSETLNLLLQGSPCPS